jgi:hypothetical protein
MDTDVGGWEAGGGLGVAAVFELDPPVLAELSSVPPEEHAHVAAVLRIRIRILRPGFTAISFHSPLVLGTI